MTDDNRPRIQRHPYLVESDGQGLSDWLAAIDKIEATLRSRLLLFKPVSSRCICVAAEQLSSSCFHIPLSQLQQRFTPFGMEFGYQFALQNIRAADVCNGSDATDGFRACAARCPLLLQERSFEARVRNDANGMDRPRSRPRWL
jgi:hypothetical protein